MPEHPQHPIHPRHHRTPPLGTTEPPHPADDDVARYRQQRQRRQRLRHPTREWYFGHSDADAVVEFARVWAPYGGAPDEEIFVRFGMSTDRFVETLWHILESSILATPFIDELAQVYQPPRR